MLLGPIRLEFDAVAAWEEEGAATAFVRLRYREEVGTQLDDKVG